MTVGVARRPPPGRWFPAKHYCIPPLQRFDLNEILRPILTERYFVPHALR